MDPFNFSDEERAIFGPLWNGVAMVCLDPERVQRRLSQVMGGADRINQLVADWKSPVPEVALPAAEEFLAGVVTAFELPAFNTADGTGAREELVLAVWRGWLDWLSKKNGSTPPSPTSSPATAGPQVPPWITPRTTASP